jgi:hypothetical protein
MDIIDFQAKTKARPGYIEHYWFENEHIGLARTLFHRVVIPFEPFDSGLEWVQQPESPELVVEWAKLDLDDPADLDGVDLAMTKLEGVEASIYLGSAHNWTDLKRFKLTKTEAGFHVSCLATIEFESEDVAENELLEFEATAVCRGEAQHAVAAAAGNVYRGAPRRWRRS